MTDESKSVLELITKEATTKLLMDLVNISSPKGEEVILPDTLPTALRARA